MTSKDYYPLCNSGETIENASKKDSSIMYCDSPLFVLRDFYLISLFDIERNNFELDGEFILFEIDGKPDFQVLTSLN